MNCGESKLQKNFSNWCPEIYRGLYVGKFNDDRISIAPCCQAQQKIVPVDGFDFDKNEYLQSLRKQFSSGEKPQACSRCWEAEKVGFKSRRLSAIDFYNIEYGNQDTFIECLDYSTTWACNLGCIMCGPDNSSFWANELNLTKKDLIKIGKYSQKQNNFLLKIDAQNLKKLHFNGGEPLINHEHAQFLKTILKNNNNSLFVSYNTNGTIYPSDDVIELWNNLGLVKLFFSIDGTGSAYEYVRWPGNWKQTADNLLAMKSKLPSNVMFGFNVTVGCYNLLDIRSIWEWFSKNLQTNREGDTSDFNWQLAYNFNPGMMTSRIKHIAVDMLKDIDVFSGLTLELKKTLNNDQNDSWIERLDRLDRRRGTNWRTSLAIGQYYQ